MSRNAPQARPPGLLGRILRLSLFVGAIWLTLSLLDARLADQAEGIVAVAQADWQQHQLGPLAHQPWRYQTQPLEADVCNTLSGGLWFGFLMPRSNRVSFPDGMRLESPRAYHCSRSSRTVLILTAG